MPYAERAKLYQKIEALRERPLLAYVTSSRRNAAGQIDADVLPQFAKQLLAIPANHDHIDLLLASEAGDAIVAWRVMGLVRERFAKVAVLLPEAASGAAALLALGADEIVMHPFATLGPLTAPPVFPKRSEEQHNGQTVQEAAWGVEELRHFFKFVEARKEESPAGGWERALELVCKEAGAMAIGAALHRANVAATIGEKLLNCHLDQSRAVEIAMALQSAFSYEGCVLNRREAQALGLPIVPPGTELQELLWQIWQDVEDEMKCHKPFDPLELVFRNSEAAALLGPVLQMQWPANALAETAQQVYGHILQQVRSVPIPAVDYSLFQALLESVRCKSEFRSQGKINAARQPDMSIAVNLARFTPGWRFSKNLDAPAENSSQK